jgi:hypothetical protein
MKEVVPMRLKETCITIVTMATPTAAASFVHQIFSEAFIKPQPGIPSHKPIIAI